MNNTILKLENQTLFAIIRMELNGVKIDLKKCKKVHVNLEKIKSSLVVNIQQHCNKEININSSEQLAKLLFEDLGLQPQLEKVGKNGNFSVDKSHLLKLYDQHQVVALLLDYRKTVSLLNFCKQLEKVNPKTKRLHGQFNQIGTATGRLSCSKPNLQNIPNIKVEDDETSELKILESQFREMFIPKKGCVFICADYSQIELRVAAEMSQDKFLLKAYNTGMDIHTLTASEVFKIKLSEVTSQQRKIAKSIYFGLIYGKTPIGLAQTLTEITGEHYSIEKAQEIMDTYFERFSGVKTCLDGLIDFADTYGYSKTIFGRKRPIPQLTSNKLSERNQGKRAAMNSPIQGTAADIIKMAMVACDQKIIEQNLQSKMVLQVHDELLFEVPKNEIEIMKKLVRETMENVVQLSIPIEVGLEIGKNWAMAH